jgi:membrane fusion protein (multidrug efflux system)
MKKKILYTVVILVLLAIVFYPKYKAMFISGEGGTEQNATQGGKQRLSVLGQVLKWQTLQENIYSTGSIMPEEVVDLTFEAQGKITDIYFQEGSFVAEGTLLAKINDAPLQAELLKLQSQLRLAKEREARQKQLLEKDAVSVEYYNQAQTEVLTLAADIQLVEARIAETELRAPFDGIIGLRNVSEGAFAAASLSIATLAKVSALRIEFSIPERHESQVKPGMKVFFTVDGETKVYEATVYALDSKIDLNTRTLSVRALYQNAKRELSPGRFVSITLQLADFEKAIAIPTQAIIPELGQEKVFLYKNGKAKARVVTTGLRTDKQVQIVDGITVGDTLITSGILQMREGVSISLDRVIE